MPLCDCFLFIFYSGFFNKVLGNQSLGLVLKLHFGIKVESFLKMGRRKKLKKEEIVEAWCFICKDGGSLKICASSSETFYKHLYQISEKKLSGFGWSLNVWCFFC